MKITFTKHYLEAQITPDDLELEAPCPGTAGRGGCTLGKLPSGGVCPVCHGRGIVPTALGLHFLAFVIRHAGQYRKDMNGKPTK
jgi:hypothetical protein